MTVMHVRPFAVEDTDAVIALWRACDLTRSWNDPARDIERKLAVSDDLLLVGTVDDRVVGAVMAGYEGHRGWINYLAVDPKARGVGHGRALMAAAELRLREVGCPKINLQVRDTNPDALAFYERIGFTIDAVISLGKRLVVENRRVETCAADPESPATPME